MMRKIIFTISTFILSLLTMMFSSCGEAEFEYSSAPCYLIIDNSLHHDATLASALTQYSGTYVTIAITTKSGARYFSFTNNVGKHTESIFNAYDERRSLLLGYNGGLIVGYGNSIDGVLYAYDRECPNCYDLTGTPIAGELTTDAYNLYDADGKLCSIGYCYECYGIIVNEDLLAKAGYQLSDITNFETLKAVAEDIHARASELGFDAFTSSSMSDDSSWRFTGHLANLEYYYESGDDPGQDRTDHRRCRSEPPTPRSRSDRTQPCPRRTR